MFVFLTVRLRQFTSCYYYDSGEIWILSLHISSVVLGEIRDIIKINYRNVQGQLVKYRYHMFPHSLFPDNTKLLNKLSIWTTLLDPLGEEILVPLMLELRFCCLLSIWQHMRLSPSLPRHSVRQPQCP